MVMRWGLGPVFAFEWLTTSRRWQVYAARALFVAALLAGLAVVCVGESTTLRNPSIRDLARVGQVFFQAIAGIQLALVLLAAPAATAGSVCLDKARGTLAHVLVTDLSSAEVILGKLAARLVPVVGLLLCTLPVVALGTLLGGIDPVALTGAFLVALGVAVLGCALALALSVWGTKTHEVLLVTYAIWVAWLLCSPTWACLQWVFGWGYGMPEWLEKANPFWLTFGPSVQPGSVGLGDQAVFLAVTLLASAALAAVSAARVRAVAARQAGRSPQRRRRWPLPVGLRAWARHLPGPSLDGNPVLWREWHRQRPWGWGRMVWRLYAAGSLGFSLLVVFRHGNRMMLDFGSVINGFQASIGLLLLSVSSATSLAEERQRGSLDVLLATPLPTRAIVWGKWWGTYRTVPWLAILPGVLALEMARQGGHWDGVALVVGLVLSYGAALVSLGLALATWVPRLGRAVALTVSIYVVIAVGSPFLAMALFANRDTTGAGVASASPFFGVGFLSAMIQQNYSPDSWITHALWAGCWIITYTTAAALLYVATLLTFNPCLGRTDDAPLRRPPAVPKPGPKIGPALE